MVGCIFKEAGERQISEMETLVHEIHKRVWSRAPQAETPKGTEHKESTRIYGRIGPSLLSVNGIAVI